MDNYADGFVKLNGIYYRVTTTEKLIWGDEVVIVAVQGNAISLEKETSKNDIS
jgi:membrane protein implicated in regulation of membrane protease activity